jgi:hypothetical protein
MQWEYAVGIWHDVPGSEDWAGRTLTALNNYGREGWELVTFERDTHGWLFFVMKRQVTP